MSSGGAVAVIFHADGPTLFQDLSSFTALGKDEEHDCGQSDVPPPANMVPWPRSPQQMPLQDRLFCKYAVPFAVHLMSIAEADMVFSLGGHRSFKPEEVVRGK